MENILKAKILFVDDDEALGKYTKEALEARGHKVDWIREDAWERAAAAIDAIADKDWDLLILDIKYPTDNWGGLWLYNQLVRKGLRSCWGGREIIYSQYFMGKVDLQKAKDSQMFTLRVFLDTANIPFDRAMSNQTFDRATLVQKIDEVLRR
jgi:CheY-like chemotaxis protein